MISIYKPIYLKDIYAATVSCRYFAAKRDNTLFDDVFTVYT